MKRYYADKAKDNSLIILPDGEYAEKSDIADETVSQGLVQIWTGHSD